MRLVKINDYETGDTEFTLTISSFDYVFYEGDERFLRLIREKRRNGSTKTSELNSLKWLHGVSVKLG